MESNTAPARMFFRSKWVKLVLVFDVLLIIAIVIIAVINGMKSSILGLNITPIDAQVLINGKEYENSNSYRMRPGEYEVSVSREGLETKKFEIKLEGDSILDVTTFLAGDDDSFEFYELAGNYESFYRLAGMASVEYNITVDQDTRAEEFIAKYQKAYDLFTSGVLPINYTEYATADGGGGLVKDVTIMVNRDGDCTKTMCIKALMVGTDSKELIADLLASKGLKAEDYEIIYKVY